MDAGSECGIERPHAVGRQKQDALNKLATMLVFSDGYEGVNRTL